jgi:type II secretory pathway pseudopilin PulG
MRLKANDENGFTMIMTVIGITLVALIAAVAVTAVSGSSKSTAGSLDRQQAYEAAVAGLHEYSFHLHEDTGFWAKCTDAVAPGPLNALNDELPVDQRVNANRRAVPGMAGAMYEIELLPANGAEKCDPTELETATATMIQSQGDARGTFRIRSTGFANEKQVSVVATFHPESFLDYVYFTQRETSDPVTYGVQSLIEAADRQCSKTLQEGRTETELENLEGTPLGASGEALHEVQVRDWRGRVTETYWANPHGERESLQYCDTISSVSGDDIKGPMHTDDAFVMCNYPILGRGSRDPIEVSAPKPGWYSTRESFLNSNSNCVGHPTFKGTFRPGAANIVPPASNRELEEVVEPNFHFNGEVAICLDGPNMTVARGKSCSGPQVYTGPQPPNGVIYDSSEVCTGAYSPFNVSYEMSTVSECGNVNVSGKYSMPLTIAAANDVVITGNLEKEEDADDGMLGLIANNFIRVYHPVSMQYGKCNSRSSNAPGSISDLKIEAALLAIQHSFIVDNYNCGPQLGNLNVFGAIAQNYRGAVGTTGSTGYLKDYVYDERFKTTEPPYFIQPIESEWVIGSETIE